MFLIFGNYNPPDLAELKLAVPMKSRAADWMYDQECVARLKSNHRDRWLSGKKLSAVTEVLSVYEGILEEEHHLSSSALIAITTTAKNYLGGILLRAARFPLLDFCEYHYRVRCQAYDPSFVYYYISTVYCSFCRMIE